LNTSLNIYFGISGNQKGKYGRSRDMATIRIVIVDTADEI